MRAFLPLAALLSLSGLCTAKLMTYDEALGIAQQGNANHEVLGAFRREYAKWATATDPADLIGKRSLEVNLAALLLDLANNNADATVYMPMYKEAEKLSKQVLAHIPGDPAAKSNLKAAQSSMKLRTGGAADATAGLDDMDDESDSSSDSDSDSDEDSDEEDSDDDDDEVLVTLSKDAEAPSMRSGQKASDVNRVPKFSEDSDEEDENESSDTKKGGNKSQKGGSAGAGERREAKLSDASDSESEDEDASSTCAGGQCVGGADGWLGAWAQDANAWREISATLKKGKIAVIKGFFDAKKADEIRNHMSRVPKVQWADRYGGSRRGGLALTPQSKGWGDALKDSMDIVTGAAFRDRLSTGAGASLDGPVPVGGVWLRPGEHERVSNSATVAADGKELHARVGLVVMLAKGWIDELGGDFLWASPFTSVPAEFNTAILFPFAGVGRGLQMVERSGEGLKHLHVFATFTTKDEGKAKALDEAAEKASVRQKDSAGIVVDGAAGSVTKL